MAERNGMRIDGSLIVSQDASHPSDFERNQHDPRNGDFGRLSACPHEYTGEAGAANWKSLRIGEYVVSADANSQVAATSIARPSAQAEDWNPRIKAE